MTLRIGEILIYGKGIVSERPKGVKKILEEIMAIKKDWRNCRLKVAVFFPNFRSISYYSLGYQIVYRILNSYEEVVAERFTIDSPCSIESGRPISEFDVIAVSSNYEMNYPNIARFVKASKFLEQGKPVLIGGITTYNPGPLLKMSTHIGIGDAELLIPGFLKGDLSGYLLSEDPQRVNAKICKKIDHWFQRYQVMPKDPEAHLLLETSRGCPHRCLFCLYGNVRRKVALRSYETIIKDLEFWKEIYHPVSRIEVVSSQPMAHPKIIQILEKCLDLGFSYSLPSLRVEVLNDFVLNWIEAGGSKTLTIAPENSERIRESLGKYFSNEDLYSLAKMIKKRKGISSVKMYFMTGIIGEEEKDIFEMKEIVENFRRISGKRIKISINFLVPKPFASPLSELSLKNLRKLNYKAKLIQRLFKISISPKKAYVQGIFSLGGPEVGEQLMRNPEIGTNFSLWKKIVEKLGIDPLENPWPYWEYVKL